MKVESAFGAKWPIRTALISTFCSMKRLGVFLFLPAGCDVGPWHGFFFFFFLWPQC